MQVFIITGASDGIGAEMARQLAGQRGAKCALVLASRHADKLNQVAQECQALGASTLVIPTDVGVQAQCIALIAQTMARFGRIDALINNAGMSAHAMLADVQDLSWYETLMRINFWGAVWCTHAALPHLIASRGRIVAVSSLVGLIGIPGRTAYSSTKAAMNGFFESLRLELGPVGVSVTLAYPGVVDTNIRKNGFNAKGQAAGVSSLKEKGAMSVQTCAALILKAMQQGKREVVMTAQGKLSRYAKLLLPSLVDRQARAVVAEV